MVTVSSSSPFHVAPAQSVASSGTPQSKIAEEVNALATVLNTASIAPANNRNYLFSLPNELLTNVINRLDKSTQDNVRLSCRRLAMVSDQSIKKLKVHASIDIKDMLSYAKRLRNPTITLKGTSFSKNDLALLSPDFEIKSIALDLSNCFDLTDSMLADLIESIPYPVSKVDLSWCTKITDDGLKPMGSVEVLNLERCHNLTGKGFQYLESVKRLNLEYCSEIENSAFKHIAHVTHVYLNGCEQITDEALTHFKNVIHLQVPNSKNITDKGISCLKSIRVLDISDAEHITDECFQELNFVTHLNISGCNNVTQKGISNLKSAKYVNLGFCLNLINKNVREILPAGCEVIEIDQGHLPPASWTW